MIFIISKILLQNKFIFVKTIHVKFKKNYFYINIQIIKINLKLIMNIHIFYYYYNYYYYKI